MTVELISFILTEKPSVAMDFARGLGVRDKKDGYFENDSYIITWAVGYLVELFELQDHNPSWEKWIFENLPVIPDTYGYKPIKMNGSRAATIRLKDLFSIGRVQTDGSAGLAGGKTKGT